MAQPHTSNIIDVGDVLVIGAGLAGLFTALKLAPRPVTIMAAGKRKKGSASQWAQGGIAAAIGADDSIESHIADTIAAGAGLVDDEIARLVATDAAARIADLADSCGRNTVYHSCRFFLQRQEGHIGVALHFGHDGHFIQFQIVFGL